MVIESRRSALQGVLIQATKTSQDSHGWDNRVSSMDSGMGFYAPVTAEPFGLTMHPAQCGCEGCCQEGISARPGLGDLNPFSKMPLGKYAPALALIGLGAAFYLYAKHKR